ncbi:hypothetical protein D3C80_2091900 [compost metagenome]
MVTVRFSEAEILQAVPGVVTFTVRTPEAAVAVIPVGVPIAVSRPAVIVIAVAETPEVNE